MVNNLIVPRTKKATRMTTNIAQSNSNDGAPISEITASGFSAALHNDANLGLLLVIDDLELYPNDALDYGSISCTITPATWRRLAALVKSGAVDALLQRAD